MSEPQTNAEDDGRWELIRDVLAFQLKLAVDALRDLVLVPVSLGAAALDLLGGTDRERTFFYRVLVAGRRTEAWINLFGEAERVAPRSEEGDHASIDRVMGRVEALLVEQVERGGVTAQAKAAIDRSLDALARRPRRRADASPEVAEPASRDGA